MKKIAYIISAALAIAGCSNRSGEPVSDTGEDMVENGKIGYADIVSFIVQGYQCGWEGMSPEDLGLSSVYSYSSEFAGFAEKDIDGDGIPELLLGDQFPDGTYAIYDIFTINPADGSLFHLAKGGERDTYTVNGSGVIVEEGSNSAFDSFQKGFRIEDGKLVKLERDTAWEDSLMILEFESFAVLADRSRLVGAFGDQREPDEEEMEMFRAAVADDVNVVYSPLSVSTQVVAGINYRFWCRFQDVSPDTPDAQKAEDERYGHCWVTIYQPLPGQGEPRVTSVEKVY